MSATINIRRGEHQHPVPPNAATFLRDQLESRGVEGSYVAHWGPAVKGKPTQDRFRAIKPTDRNTVEVYLRPGGNDTAHIAWLRPENGHGLANKDLYYALMVEPKEEPDEERFRFTEDEDRVTRLLKLFATEDPDLISIEDLREACNAVFGERGNMAWGQVFSALERNGFLELQRGGGGRYIKGARLTDKSRGRPGVQEVLSARQETETLAPETPAPPGDLTTAKGRLEARGQELMEEVTELEQQLESKNAELDSVLKKIDVLDAAIKVVSEVES